MYILQASYTELSRSSIFTCSQINLIGGHRSTNGRYERISRRAVIGGMTLIPYGLINIFGVDFICNPTVCAVNNAMQKKK